jgi:glycosyltransferase involved in cell wall biosynthesis
LFVGRLSPVKGLHVLLAAMPKVLAQFPKIKLKVISGYLHGNALNEYREHVAKLNIAGNIEFLGWQSKQDTEKAFREANFSIVPSLVEAFGFVVIESFSVGTPVVGSNTTGIAEIIRDGQDGFLFEPGNADDLAEKILWLLGDNALRMSCSANCSERFAGEFEMEIVTDRLRDEIRKLD